MSDFEVTDDALVELVRAHSDPPLCRVCGEPLTWGSSDRDGSRWAHYVRAPVDERTGESPLWHQPTQDHINASYRLNPEPSRVIVAVAQELLARRQADAATPPATKGGERR